MHSVKSSQSKLVFPDDKGALVVSPPMARSVDSERWRFDECDSASSARSTRPRATNGTTTSLSKDAVSPLPLADGAVPSAHEAKAVFHTRKEDIVKRRPTAELTREEAGVPGRRQIISLA
jgi:hypothetical protein